MFKYEIDLTWQEDRKGIVSSPELPLSIEVATPPEFPKGIPGIWSPEHFFVAAINSCLMTTFLAVAENSKLEFLKFDCKAIGTVDKVEGKYMVTEVILRPVLVIHNTEHQDKAKRIIEMSEKACMISNSVTSKIILEPTVLVE
jgi:peroxiredoxin-like protein